MQWQGPLLLGIVGLLRNALAASTVTITIATGTCPAPSGLRPSSVLNVYTYATTNSAGQVYITSATTYLPASPPASTPISSSATPVTSSVVPVVKSTTVVGTYTSNGNVYTGYSIETFAATPTIGGPSTSTLMSYEAARSSPCPAGVAQPYTDSNGEMYQLFCLADFRYNDLPGVNESTFSGCIGACDDYVTVDTGPYAGLECVGVTWTEYYPNLGNCFLKYRIDDVVYGSDQLLSAKLASYNPPTNLSVSVLSSYTSSLPTPSASVSLTSAASSTITTSVLYFVASSVTSSTPVTTGILTTTTASSTDAATASQYPCPTAAGSRYMDSVGAIYQIYCDTTFEYYDEPNASTLQGSFDACMQQCDSYVPTTASGPGSQPCVGVSYTPGLAAGSPGATYNCYLEYNGYVNATQLGTYAALKVSSY